MKSVMVTALEKHRRAQHRTERNLTLHHQHKDILYTLTATCHKLQEPLHIQQAFCSEWKVSDENSKQFFDTFLLPNAGSSTE